MSLAIIMGDSGAVHNILLLDSIDLQLSVLHGVLY